VQVLPFLLVANAALIHYGVVERPAGKAAGSGAGAGADTTAQHSQGHGLADTATVLLGDPRLRKLGLVTMLYFAPVYGVISTMLVYLTAQFGFNHAEGASMLAAIGCTAVVACGAGIPWMTSRGLHARHIVQIGLSSLCCSLAALGCGWQASHFYLSAMFLGWGFTVMPGVNALVAEAAPPGAQGAAQGAIHGVKALTEGVGPLLFAGMFGLVGGDSRAPPGTPYLIGAASVIGALIVAGTIPAPPGHGVQPARGADGAAYTRK